MGLNQSFLFYNYNSDNGQQYIIKLSTDDAAAGGFGGAVDSGSGAPWGYRRKNLRHVLGNDGAGHKTRLPLASSANALFVGGGSFTLQGRTYAVQGQIGEARRKNYIG